MYPENIQVLVLKMLKMLTKEKQKKSLLVSIDMPVKRAAALTGINEKKNEKKNNNNQQMDKEDSVIENE